MRVFDGQLSVITEIGSGEDAPITAALKGSKLSAGPLLSAVVGAQPLTGALAGDLQFTVAGSGADAVEGKGGVSVFGGSITGIDLLQHSRGVEAPDAGGTDFAALSAALDLSDGRLGLRDLSISAVDAAFSGEAVVGLSDGAVSGRLLPDPRPSEVLYPLDLGGTLDRLEARADRSAAVVNLSSPPAEPEAAAEPPTEITDEGNVAIALPEVSDEQSALLEDTSEAQQSDPSPPEDARGPESSPIPTPAPR